MLPLNCALAYLHISVRVTSVGLNKQYNTPRKWLQWFQYICCHHLFLGSIIHHHATVIKVGWKMSQYMGQIRGGCVWVYRCWMEASHKPVLQCFVYIQPISAEETVCPALALCGIRVCHVGSSALLLISSVHAGSKAALCSTVWETKVISLFSLSHWLVRIETQSSSYIEACAANKGQAAGCSEKEDRSCC